MLIILITIQKLNEQLSGLKSKMAKPLCLPLELHVYMIRIKTYNVVQINSCLRFIPAVAMVS